ncbi:hypothetical protein U1Q18_047455 [Sarracenia purpurea var. burkii]
MLYLAAVQAFAAECLWFVAALLSSAAQVHLVLLWLLKSAWFVVAPWCCCFGFVVSSLVSCLVAARALGPNLGAAMGSGVSSCLLFVPAVIGSGGYYYGLFSWVPKSCSLLCHGLLATVPTLLVVLWGSVVARALGLRFWFANVFGFVSFARLWFVAAFG